MQQTSVDALLASLTPARVREVVLGIAAAKPAARQTGVSMPDVVDGALIGVELAEGPDGWRARMRVKAAIVAALAEVPGLTYVEGDA